jgi:hypothetical protein
VRLDCRGGARDSCEVPPCGARTAAWQFRRHRRDVDRLVASSKDLPQFTTAALQAQAAADLFDTVDELTFDPLFQWRH